MNTIRWPVLIGVVTIAALAGISRAHAQAAALTAAGACLSLPTKATATAPIAIRSGSGAEKSGTAMIQFVVQYRRPGWQGGAVKVFVSRGDKRADGIGRLTRTGGGGKWKSSRGECSGRWMAERRG